MKKGIVVVVLAILAGCTNLGQKQVWSRAGTTEQQYNRDMAECSYDAEKTAAPLYRRSVIEQEVTKADVRQRIVRECMLARGYSLKLE